MSSKHVWYVSYGSNMAADRFACYVRGGLPSGGRRAHPGARDATPPVRSMPVDLPGTVYFAGESTQWGGGVAFYDHATPSGAVGRGYLVTAGQFADIAAQEMHRIPQEGDPLEEVVTSPLPAGGHTVGPGRYETVVEVGRADDLPLLTFTSPHGADHIEHSSPTDAYLTVLRAGLRESRGWDDDQVDDYLTHILPADQADPGQGRPSAR